MKKFLLAFVAVFVLTAGLSFVIHGLLLNPLYQQTPQLGRTPEDAASHSIFLMVGFFFFSLGFVWICARGIEAKPWVGQGFRYGIAVWLIAAVSRYFIYYAIQPWSMRVVLLQIGYELVMMLLLGLTVAGIYRRRRESLVIEQGPAVGARETGQHFGLFRALKKCSGADA